MTIEQMWEGYKKYCVSPEAGEVQIKETRQAFYAGFISMFEINNKIGEPGFPEQRAFNLLTKLQEEINRYLRYQQQKMEEFKKQHDSN